MVQPDSNKLAATEMSAIQIPVENLETYAYADLAAGKGVRNKRRRARQAIVVGGRDWLQRWFWLSIWAGRETASQFKDRILDTQEEWNPRRFGLEANGMQVLFGNLVRDEARERFGNVKMLPIYQPTTVEKTYRIRTGFEPVILQGRCFLQEKEIEARAEIAGFPTAATRDIIDAMETLVNRVAPKQHIKASKDREEEEYAKYLRASGMHAHKIKEALAHFRSGRTHTLH